MSKRILRYADLEKRGYGHRATVWRAVRDGRFPPPRNILGRPGWDVETVDEYERTQPEITYPVNGAA